MAVGAIHGPPFLGPVGRNSQGGLDEFIGAAICSLDVDFGNLGAFVIHRQIFDLNPLAHMPMDTLKGLGFRITTTNVRPIRWPLSGPSRAKLILPSLRLPTIS